MGGPGKSGGGKSGMKGNLVKGGICKNQSGMKGGPGKSGGCLPGMNLGQKGYQQGDVHNPQNAKGNAPFVGYPAAAKGGLGLGKNIHVHGAFPADVAMAKGRAKGNPNMGFTGPNNDPASNFPVNSGPNGGNQRFNVAGGGKGPQVPGTSAGGKDKGGGRIPSNQGAMNAAMRGVTEANHRGRDSLLTHTSSMG